MRTSTQSYSRVCDYAKSTKYSGTRTNDEGMNENVVAGSIKVFSPNSFWPQTLNQFYDDSLNRSTVEVPDDDGRETRHNLSGFSHGCSSNKIEGNAPLDFDGSALNNSAQESHISRRIIGEHAVKQLSHGTAEPEMRGLYMLLTMNNEGGMEVLKYAAKLFQERPEIYHSKPVQLALEIFKVCIV